MALRGIVNRFIGGGRRGVGGVGGRRTTTGGDGSEHGRRRGQGTTRRPPYPGRGDRPRSEEALPPSALIGRSPGPSGTMAGRCHSSTVSPTHRMTHPAAPTRTRCSTPSRRGSAEQGLTLYPAQEEALIESSPAPTSSCPRRPAPGRAWSPPARTSRRWPTGERTFYTAPIKALVSEKFFALCDVFGAEQRRHAHRRRRGQRRGADHLLHRRGAGQHRAARGRRRRRRPGGDGRVPLLRRARPRLGLAGAAARAAAGAVPADVGDPRRRHPVRRTT